MPELTESLLNKFFHDQCTAAEEKIVIEWLLNAKNEHWAKAAMKKHWDSVDGNGPEVDIERLLMRTTSQRRQRDGLQVMGVPKGRRWFERASLAVAASIAVIALSTVALVMVLKDTFPGGMTFALKNEEVRTSTGQIILKVLPDGTKVWLNAQSTLVYPSSFTDTREVTLEGEAFFDVVEDAAHPFIVHADGINIRVLGTAFNIKSYPGEPSIATTLVRGKVLIENESSGTGEPIALKPNQQALFSHASNGIELIQVDAKRYSAWTDGRLVFEDDRVYDVFKTLERWYGVAIHVPDEANLDCRLTARIDKETLAETLELLKSITGIHYTMTDDEVTIEGKVCVP